MKKLIQSAFALSLGLMTPQIFAQTEAIDDFLGLETELMPDLDGPQRFSPPDLHEAASWKVTEKETIQDKEPLKGQGHSIIPWATLDPESWLNIDIWMAERAIKDKLPDWQMRLRDERNLELMGRILKCVGTCPVFRGLNKAHGQYLSRLHEGDEIRTEKNSSVWIVLVDGTLVRLGAESSLNLQEINFSVNESFVLARLNRGHVFWHPRTSTEYVAEFAPETDAASLPLMIREANQQFFERQLFSSQTSFGRLSEVMDLDESAIKAQVKKINEKRTSNLSEIKSKSMLVSPNSTLISTSVSFDFLHVPGGKSYFKKRNSEALDLHLRGYTNTEALPISDMSWHEIDALGRSQETLKDVPGELQVSELLTKRIKSIELAREDWVEKFSLPIFSALKNPKELAVNHGYTLWGPESSKRLEFLVEYTRRIETSNLRSMDNVLKKLEDHGEKIDRNLSSVHYQFSLNYYLNSLKSRYTQKKMQVKEMNDLQYYVWILKNGKI